MSEEEIEFLLADDKPFHVQLVALKLLLFEPSTRKAIAGSKYTIRWLGRNGGEIMRQEKDPTSYIRRLIASRM